MNASNPQLSTLPDVMVSTQTLIRQKNKTSMMRYQHYRTSQMSQDNHSLHLIKH